MAASLSDYLSDNASGHAWTLTDSGGQRRAGTCCIGSGYARVALPSGRSGILSDSGSEMGAAVHGQRSPASVNVGSNTALSCPAVSSTCIGAAVCSVVVLDVGGSNPLTHPILYGR